MLLMGEYHHQIDEKSRIRIPSKLKEALGESPVILKGTDGCLFVYSQEAMQNMFATKFANNDFTQADNQLPRFCLRQRFRAFAMLQKRFVPVPLGRCL